jgi:hypothetical protein
VKDAGQNLLHGGLPLGVVYKGKSITESAPVNNGKPFERLFERRGAEVKNKRSQRMGLFLCDLWFISAFSSGVEQVVFRG